MVGGDFAVQALYASSALLSAALAVVLWRARESRGALPLFVAMVSLVLWGGGTFGQTLVGNFGTRQFINVTFVGIAVVPTATFVFALEYTGRERYLNRTVLGLLSIHPVATILAVITNPGNLFYRTFTEAPQRAVGYEGQMGPLFQVHVIYSYSLILVSVALILAFVFRQKRELYLGQALTLVVGALAPVPFNLIFLLDLVTFDATLIGAFVTISMLTLAIVRYQLADLTPIAREKVIDNVRDGMIVTDTAGRVVDSNPAARRLTDMRTDQPIGTLFSQLVDHYPALVAAYEELTATAPGEQVSGGEQTLSYAGRDITMDSSPIFDDRERHVGWVLLLQDITEQKQRERDLKEQIEKLDQFASVVSHDLRNPINVAQGYVQHTQATGEIEHLDKTTEAFERMEAIIEDVLALAREGQTVTDPQRVSLEATAREAWGTVETRGAALSIPEDVLIVADEDRLTRLFENLFRNALEHGVAEEGTASDLTLTVGVTARTGTDLTFFVADDGIGIPEENLDDVLEGGFTTNTDGTGLGLSIVEQIATAHDWTVTVTHSEAGGARFEFSSVDWVDRGAQQAGRDPNTV